MLRAARVAAFTAVASLATGGFSVPAIAADEDEAFDYFAANRDLIRNGVQAVLTCNGLFTSGRSIEQVLEQELAYLDERRFGEAGARPYSVHGQEQAVRVGGGEHGPTVTAAFRRGIGCVVMAPEAPLSAVADLPELTLPYPAGDPRQIPWPDGDLVEPRPLPEDVDAAALQAVSDWAFNRPTEEQDTLSLLIVHRGHIVHERYAPGVNQGTRTRTWSTAKSIASTLIGMQVDAGALSLDQPLDFDWLPELVGGGADPRDAITLRNVLQMSSGLYPVDSFNMEYATGSGVAYWAGASSVEGALRRALVREPGSYWDYENYDTLLAVYALKRSLPSERAYREFGRRALLDRIGMRSTLLSTDRFGDFIMSSQIYTNARDLARFGLLYLNGGVWNGERLLSEDWIDFVRTPAPAALERGIGYGGQFWLVPPTRQDEIPADAYATSGNRGQYVIVVPSHDLVIVRRGLDYGKQGFSLWELLRETIKAFPTVPH